MLRPASNKLECHTSYHLTEAEVDFSSVLLSLCVLASILRDSKSLALKVTSSGAAIAAGIPETDDKDQVCDQLITVSEKCLLSNKVG
jgi:hypothetical protein